MTMETGRYTKRLLWSSGQGRMMVGAAWWHWRGSITDKAEIHVRDKNNRDLDGLDVDGERNKE